MKFLKSVSILLVFLMVLCTCTVASATPIKDKDTVSPINMKVGEVTVIPLPDMYKNMFGPIHLEYDKTSLAVWHIPLFKVLFVKALKPGNTTLKVQLMDKKGTVRKNLDYVINVRPE